MGKPGLWGVGWREWGSSSGTFCSEFLCWFAPEQASSPPVSRVLCQNGVYVSLRSSLLSVNCCPAASSSSREMSPNEQFQPGHPLPRHPSLLPFRATASELHSVSSSSSYGPASQPSASHRFSGGKTLILSLAHELILLASALGPWSSPFPHLPSSPFPSTHLWPGSVLARGHLPP